MSQYRNGGEHHVVLAEMTPSELKAPSGIDDMTNHQALEWLGSVIPGARVYLSHKMLSDEGKDRISHITRNKTGEEHPIAVVSVRLPVSHT